MPRFTSYLETLEFDLMVVFFVVVVLPASVLLMRSTKLLPKCCALTLLIVSVIYIGLFENYRLTHHRSMDASFHRAMDASYLPEEPEWRVVYLRLSNVSKYAEAILGRIDASAASGASRPWGRALGDPQLRLQATGNDVGPEGIEEDDDTAQGSKPPRKMDLTGALDILWPGRRGRRPVAGPVDTGVGPTTAIAPREALVSIAFPNSGQVLFKRIFRNYARATCEPPAGGDPTVLAAAPRVVDDAVDEAAVTSATTAGAGQRLPRLKCLSFAVAAVSSPNASSSPPSPPAADLLQLEVDGRWSAVPSLLRALNRRYWGLFVVRDPRDLVVASYYLHAYSAAGESWASAPRDVFDGRSLNAELNTVSKEEGLNREIDLLSGILDADGDFVDILGRRSPGAGELQRAVKALAIADDPAIAFLRYEDLLSGSRTALAAVGEFYGLTGLLLERFVRAASSAMAEVRSSAEAAILAGPGTAPRTSLMDCSGQEPAAWCHEIDEPSLMQPGIWRKHMGASNIAHFKAVHEGLLQQLGYESSSNWGIEH